MVSCLLADLKSDRQLRKNVERVYRPPSGTCHHEVGETPEGEWIQNISGDGFELSRKPYKTRHGTSGRDQMAGEKWDGSCACMNQCLKSKKVFAICKLSQKNAIREFFERGKSAETIT